MMRVIPSYPRNLIGRAPLISQVGPYLVSRAFVSGMVDAGWGRIINLSSAASLGTV